MIWFIPAALLASVIISPREVIDRFNAHECYRNLPFPFILIADMAAQLFETEAGMTLAAPKDYRFSVAFNSLGDGKLQFEQQERVPFEDGRRLFCEELRYLENGAHFVHYRRELEVCERGGIPFKHALPQPFYLKMIWKRVATSQIFPLVSSEEEIRVFNFLAWHFPIIYALDDPLELSPYGAKLGEGGYGRVYACECHGEQLAVKVLKSNVLCNNDEIQALRAVRGHPLFVQLYSAQLRSLEGTIELVTEFLDGKSLHAVLKKQYAIYDLRILSAIARQLVTGIHFLHQKGYRHDDIKTDNIIFTRDGRIRMIDLGLATPLTAKPKVNGLVGLTGPEHFDHALPFGAGTDTWMIGTLLLTAYNCSKLAVSSVEGLSSQSIRIMYDMAIEAALNSIPDTTPMHSHLRDFFRSIFQYDPSDRASLEALLSTPFLRQGASDDELSAWIRSVLK